MAPTEAERFELREGLRDVLGEGPVTTLMDSLPPMDWHELATKTDLAALEERIDVRFEALRAELGAKIDTGLTGLNAKIDTGLTGLNAKIDTGLAEMDARFEAVDAKFERVDARFTEMRGEMKLGLARQTYVVLAGVAVMLAGALTPIYLTLFTGAAG